VRQKARLKSKEWRRRPVLGRPHGGGTTEGNLRCPEIRLEEAGGDWFELAANLEA
jgi:hypothetical protein